MVFLAGAGLDISADAQPQTHDEDHEHKSQFLQARQAAPLFCRKERGDNLGYSFRLHAFRPIISELTCKREIRVQSMLSLDLPPRRVLL